MTAMRSALSSLTVAAALLVITTSLVVAEAGGRLEHRGIPQYNDGDSEAALRASRFLHNHHNSRNMTYTEIRRILSRGLSEEEMAAERKERSRRSREQRERAREKIRTLKPNIEDLQPLSQDDLKKASKEGHSWVRRTNWFSDNGEYSPYYMNNMADPSEEYDMWAQAYRMLGGYIDCDHDKDDDNHSGSGDNDGQEADDSACSRWMMWASYVNEDYQGNGYDEYFGDDPVSVLDCHNPDTKWKLLGVYRQEFYQFIEQISKHLWAIDEYEYVVALAGLAYMTDYDCFYVGQDNSGNNIYAGVAPKAYGKFEMALYTDDYCLTPDDSLNMNFDDFGLTSDIDLGSKDEENRDDDSVESEVYEWWYDAQEYKLEKLNEVYETFTYCTSCVDYPTYQDGYFIGDYGTDDDDLINQCWKFHSHDSFTCETDCISKGHAQGTILSVTYGDRTFGSTPDSFYTSYKDGGGLESKGGFSESRLARLGANAFLTLSFLIFVATFLAFAVARRSRQRERRSGKSRRLLDEDGRSRRSSHHKSRSKSMEDGDGLFRSRSKSADRRHKSTGRSKSKSRSEARTSGEYEPPRESTRRSSSRHKSSSRRHVDDF